MKRFSRRSRTILVAVAGALLLGNAWWFARQPAAEVQQFSLKMTTAEVRLGPEPSMLVFDAGMGTWTYLGKPVDRIIRFVRTEHNGSDFSGSYLVMAIRPPTTIAAARAAFNALIDENVCQVGLVDAAGLKSSKLVSASILRIEWVLGPDGQRRTCRENKAAQSITSG